ncbi:hypothetical protein Glove_9g310 [Diversispora epigaea]|uniref:Uncharacterized protein n=1 Tax=Diversispora epigaea TaxID=1348612 RepID=A0A397JR39_9GLOM|nr:hypothetical protein Glove_9g310 [Diversispora epigaea]
MLKKTRNYSNRLIILTTDQSIITPNSKRLSSSSCFSSLSSRSYSPLTSNSSGCSAFRMLAPKHHSPLHTSHTYNARIEDPKRNFIDILLSLFLEERFKCTRDDIIARLLIESIEDNNETPKDIYRWLINRKNSLQYKSLLGFFLLWGIGCKRSKKRELKAFGLFLAAAKKDVIIAEEMVGDCYYFGWGTRENLKMAFHWYERAAENGSGHGYLSLGFFYEFGRGIPICLNKAIDCYKTSGRLGNILGMNHMANKYKNGDGISRNLKKSIYWYNKAYKNGSMEAGTELESLKKLIERQKISQSPQRSTGSTR